MKTPEINIKKSWRKSISMRFDTHGVLQVRAPKFMLSSQIKSFLSNHQDWIEREFHKITERKDNKKYYLFGEECNPPLFDHNSVPLIKGEYWTQWNRGIIETFYKKEAKRHITSRCRELALKHGFTYESIRITSAMGRWGSCSSRKTLNFSYRLIMSPHECIDYVIIHELCHLRQMNHSAKFWKEVSNIMPWYQDQEQHLKDEGWRYRL